MSAPGEGVGAALAQAEMAADPCAVHGEGIIWDPSPGVIRLVDMLAGDVLTLDGETGEVSRLHVGSVAAAIRPRMAGGLVIAVERGFTMLDGASGVIAPGPELWSDPTVRMNDGACDPGGRFFCGSMAYDAAPSRGALYRLEPDRTVTQVLGAVTISNGLAWTQDGTTAYYVDSPTQRIDAFNYDVASGSLIDRRPVVRIDERDGTPDGLTLDADGFIWVALWGGSAVRRYSPGGRLDGVVELPISQVTSCAFGGPSLDELYISTSRHGINDEDQPQAGAIFRHRPLIAGTPPFMYAG
jgi:sugar lactone lactonase YvrE